MSYEALPMKNVSRESLYERFRSREISNAWTVIRVNLGKDWPRPTAKHSCCQKQLPVGEELMLTVDEPFTLRDQVYVQTGPGTLAGRYLRTFWQPVYHSIDLVPGVPRPLQIMSQSFVIFRGASGAVSLLDPRCPHRMAQLSIGRVEGDAIR